MITIPHGQEVLLTRQRHEADRAGLHYDYRMVLGDKAYSWATKKELPEVGSSIILWEQPVHTASYALSEKVVIPKGQYGGGTTYLEWVKKGKVSNPEGAEDKFVLETPDGRFLFKHIPSFGEKAWLFRPLDKTLEKEASFVLGAAATHLAQNAATKAALGNKHVAGYLANSFSQGAKGVIDTSFSAKAKRFIAGATVPDIAVAHGKAHDLGRAMKPLLDKSSPRQKVGLRMLSQGRIGALQKYNLHKDPAIQEAHSMVSKMSGRELPSLSAPVEIHKKVTSIFNDKSHPLASNIIKNISRGKNPVGPQFKPGTLNSKVPLLGSAASAVIDPAGGALNTVKTVASSKAFSSTSLGGKITHMLEKHFVVNPIKHGIKNGEAFAGKLTNLKNKAYELGVNPIMAHLKRTSGAMSDALRLNSSIKSK